MEANWQLQLLRHGCQQHPLILATIFLTDGRTGGVGSWRPPRTKVRSEAYCNEFEDIFLCFLALIAPYCLFLRFHPPYNLRIVPREGGTATAALCRIVWPMIIASGLLSSGAALAASLGRGSLALTLLFCAAPLFALLFVPGMVAFKQFYGWDKGR